MIHSTLLASLTAILLGAAAMTTAVAQTGAYPRSPPPQSANNQATPDMDCRQQAAAEVGYPASIGGNNQAAPSDAQQRYAAAYYDCMSGGSSGPHPSNAYAYGPSPNAYGYGPHLLTGLHRRIIMGRVLMRIRIIRPITVPP